MEPLPQVTFLVTISLDFLSLHVFRLMVPCRTPALRSDATQEDLSFLPDCVELAKHQQKTVVVVVLDQVDVV